MCPSKIWSTLFAGMNTMCHGIVRKPLTLLKSTREAVVEIFRERWEVNIVQDDTKAVRERSVQPARKPY